MDNSGDKDAGDDDRPQHGQQHIAHRVGHGNAEHRREQAEQDRLEQRRNREGSELAEDDRNDQDARRGADRKAEGLLAVKDGVDRDRQQRESFRRCRNDPLDGVDGWRFPRRIPCFRSVGRNSGTD